MNQRFARPPVPVVVLQHCHGASTQFNTRQVLLDAPHARLHQLGRLDERLAASLDGLAEAGAAGLAQCDEGLASPLPGDVFAAAVCAILARDGARLDALFALAAAEPTLQSALDAAFGWVSPADLRGITRALLDSTDPLRRASGLRACASHGVDPGAALQLALTDVDAGLRAAAHDVAGRLGRKDLLAACHRGIADPEPAVRFEAARAALRLGDRDDAPAALLAFARAPGPWREAAATLWLQVAELADAHALLKSFRTEEGAQRLLLRGIAVVGDTLYVPWLLQQMADPQLARLAGESFTAITGADIAALDLEGPTPDGAPGGPYDDPVSDDVALDADESLPWPDPARCGAWWQAHGAGLAAGQRWFCGATPTAGHLATVLAERPQRLRVRATDALTLLQPGSARFNTDAPAWRQQRQLAKLVR